MKKILLKNVFFDGKETDVRIDGNRFGKIAPGQEADAGTEIFAARGLAILPPFYNAHTHAAMSLLRGYADDMELFKWLNDYIWPYEATMKERDVYVGSRLAVLEMIRSGTVFFNDMYFFWDETIRAVEEMGIRACIGMPVTNFTGDEKIENIFARLAELPKGGAIGESGRIRVALAPHAIYTVNEKLWRRSAEFARERELTLHIHLSETEKEVEDCVAEHGMTPVRWLDSLGVLGGNVVAAHVVHVDDEELAILRERGVVIVHNPCSNMKLASGAFRAKAAARSGCLVALGTDGASSNNNLDMREEMKFAALLAKVSGDPEALPSEEIFSMATRNGARAFGIDGGEIAEGKLADAVLVDLSDERLVPNHNLISNWVYSADSRCVRHVLCDGAFVMRDGRVSAEEEIIAAASVYAGTRKK